MTDFFLGHTLEGDVCCLHMLNLRLRSESEQTNKHRRRQGRFDHHGTNIGACITRDRVSGLSLIKFHNGLKILPPTERKEENMFDVMLVLLN
jgi:hypothetical protein